MRIQVLVVVTLLALAASVFAQPPQPPPDTDRSAPAYGPHESPIPPTEKPSVSPRMRPTAPVSEPVPTVPPSRGRSMTEIYLSWGILLFGLVVLSLEVIVLLKQKQGWGANSTRIVGLTLVVVSGVFLITAGYSESQIAPMIGLLGTIVGYLLGKSDTPTKQSR
jgi:hypothetical protein